MNRQKQSHWKLAACAVAAMVLAGACTTRPPEALPAPQTAADAPVNAQIVILLRHTGTENSISHLGALKFRDRLAELSDGRMEVDIYPENALGSSADAQYALRYGTLTAHIGEPLFQVMDCLSWSSVSGGHEAYLQQLETGPVRRLVDAESAENGVHFLGVLSSEYRILSSNREIRAPADFTGLRVGVADAAYSRPFWASLDASAVACSRGQVFTALQQQVIDAQEDTIQLELVSQLLPFQPYILLSGHRLYSRVMYINRRFYDGLPEEDRRMVDIAFADTRAYLDGYVADFNSSILSELEAQGATVQALPPPLQAQMNSKTTQATLEVLRNQYGESFVDAVLAALPQ